MNTVYAFGNGDVLAQIFQGVAMLCNGKAGALTNLAGSIGLMVALFMGAAKSDPSYIGKYMAWFVLALSFLIIPKGKVVVEDRITKQRYVVANVPLVLAEGASLCSTLGYELTKEFETVFRFPAAMRYSETGLLMSSNLIKEVEQVKVRDDTMRDNLKEFASQCILYDLAIGHKYSMKDLRETDDIWKLVGEHPSKNRMFEYYDDKEKTTDRVTCYAGGKMLSKKWKELTEESSIRLGEKFFPSITKNRGAQANKKAKINFFLGLEQGSKFFMDSSKNAHEILRQKMMINSIRDGVVMNAAKVNSGAAATTYAAERAYQQQKESYMISGILAGKVMASTRSLFECLIYALFPIVSILSVISAAGYKNLLTYGGLILWINTWPLLYAVLNFVMSLSAYKATQAAMAGAESALSWMVSPVIASIHSDIAAQAGFLSMSIPFISYAVVKGGASSFMHLAGSITAVSQGAISTAASESVTGNYGYGNVNSGNISNNNLASNKYDSNSSIRSGSSSVQGEAGEMYTNTAGGRRTLDVPNSNLMDNHNVNEQVSDEMTNRAGESLSNAQSESESFVKSAAESFDNVTGLTNNFSKNKSNDSSWTQTLSEDDRKAFERVESFNEHHGITNDKTEGQSMSADGKAYVKYAAGGGAGAIVGALSGFSGGVEGSVGKGVKSENSDKFSSGISAADNEQYRKDVAHIQSISKSMKFNEGESEAKNFSESINASSRKAEEHRSNADASYRESQDYTKQASLASNKSSGYSQNLNQDYVDYLGKGFASGRISQDQHSKALTAGSTERRVEGEKFAKVQADKVRDAARIKSFKNPEQLKSAYQGNAKGIQNKGGADFKNRVVNAATQQGVYGNKVDPHVQKTVQNKLGNAERRINKGRGNLIDKSINAQKQVKEKQDQSLLDGVLPKMPDSLKGKGTSTMTDYFSPQPQHGGKKPNAKEIDYFPSKKPKGGS